MTFHLSVFFSSGTQSFKFALTSYFSSFTFLTSLYFPGNRIPVSLRADFPFPREFLAKVVGRLQIAAEPLQDWRCFRSGQLT